MDERTPIKVSRALRDKIAQERINTGGIPGTRLLEIAWDLYGKYKNTHEAFGKTLAISSDIPDNKRTEEISVAEWPYVELLLRVLRSGDGEAVDGVQTNLRLFSRVIDEQRRGNDGRRTDDDSPPDAPPGKDVRKPGGRRK